MTLYYYAGILYLMNAYGLKDALLGGFVVAWTYTNREAVVFMDGVPCVALRAWQTRQQKTYVQHERKQHNQTSS
jgi:hypothetical protein